MRPSTAGARGRGRSRGSGQSLAEFSIVVPLFILLVLGTIEFGRFVFAYEMLNHATREGVRYAIVHGSASLCPSGPMPGGAANPCDPSGAKVQDVVRNYASQVLATSDLAVDVPSWTPNNNERGSTVSVKAAYTYRPMLAIIPLPPIVMNAESSLVVNH